MAGKGGNGVSCVLLSARERICSAFPFLHLFLYDLIHLCNRFQGQKYVLGQPGRTGEVDEEEQQRLQAKRRQQRQVADILSQQGGEEGDEEEEGWSGLWGADENSAEKEEKTATSACT